MKGRSKVIMGATLVMVVSLAIVLGLILVLLAELYCSFLLRRRQLRTTTTTATATTSSSNSQPPQSRNQSAAPPAPPLSNFYSQGVLHAPRSFLFPAISSKEDKVGVEKQYSQLLQILESQSNQESNTSTPRQIGLVSASPPSPSFIPIPSPQPIQQASLQASSSGCNEGVSSCEHFVYISNPIYDNDAGPSRVDTPFETPDTSPSRLEMSGSSGDDEETAPHSSPSRPSSLPITPPLTPMKKLPAKACSVSLKNARSLGTSGSDSNSNNGLSSSSSGSPCTSPSW